MKRAFDFTASLLALILLSPLLALLTIMVRLRLGGPAFFTQLRPGLNGKPFRLIKFRTMLDARDASGNPLPDEKRLVPFGRFLRSTSLDELPELVNVVRGEMSLVGPRPLLLEYLNHYTPGQAKRHDVLPGITGWAQINGRNTLSWEAKFDLDRWYVENHSFSLDLKILFMTVFQVLRRDGISAEGHATMPIFNRAVAVVGGGGHAKVVISTLRALGIPIQGVYDDDSSKWGQKLLDVTIVGGTELLAGRTNQRAVIAVGNNATRRKIAERLTLDWQTLVHPNAVVDSSVRLGPGTVVFAGAIVQAATVIGAHGIVNTGATVDHDCALGDFTHVAPGVNLCGGVMVGEGALLGVGCKINILMRVGAWSTIGAGAVVVSEIPDRVTAVGVPARPVSPPSGVTMSMTDEIPMSFPEMDESDVQGVIEVIRSGRLSLGAKVPEFEKTVAEYVGVKHAIAVSSGTAALHLAVKALGIGPGDEVLVPSFTFAASVNAFLFEGARPVWVDIDPVTYNLDPRDLERKITPNCKAVMVVDVFGHPAPWTEILAIARKHGLKVIDDSCEALGAEYRGKRVGSFGDAAAFAFYPNKQITTGEGGILVTNDDEIARLCRSYRNQGRNEMGQWLEHARLGYNYRMDEMSGSLGCTQMKRIESFIAKREQVARSYTRRLRELSWVQPPAVLPHARMSWFVYVIALAEGLDRDAVISGMQARGVPARAYFSPIHSQAYFSDRPSRGGDRLPVTTNVAARTLALPFHNNLTEAQIDRVVTALREVVAELRPLKRVA